MAQTVSVQIQQWHLDDHAAMSQCLYELSSQGFRGQVRVHPEPTPPDAPEDFVPQQLWDLELNDNSQPDRPAVQAVTGQVVVFFGGVLQVMGVEQYTDNFGVAP